LHFSSAEADPTKKYEKWMEGVIPNSEIEFLQFRDACAQGVCAEFEAYLKVYR
jgi:hypothetical protein